MATLNTTALASVLVRRAKGYTDEISRQIPLFKHLKSKGSYQGEDGGSSYEWDVEYLLDTDEPSFDGWDVLPNQASDAVQVAQAAWKSYYKPIAINGTEFDLNNGGNGGPIFKLLAQKEKNAKSSMRNQMNTHIYEVGTANGAKRLVGLAAILAAAPTTGTLFNINRATAGNEFWRNSRVDTGAVAFDYSDGIWNQRNGMNTLWQQCGRQADVSAQRFPDLILCTEAYWRYYSEVAAHRGQRFVNTNEADAGYNTLLFNNASMLFDQDCPADAGSDAQAFFINSDVMKLLYIKSCDFKLSDAMPLETQDGLVKRLIWRGALICTNPQKCGVHEGIAATQA
jgi:hypothetical protein